MKISNSSFPQRTEPRYGSASCRNRSCHTSLWQAKTCTRMAALAICESQIAAERPFPIMAAQTTLPAGWRKVFRGRRRSHLPTLGQTGCQRVTRGTFQTLSGTMFRMTEAKAERARIRRGAPVPFLTVTDAARCDFAPRRRLAGGGVTNVALVMRANSSGN